MTAPVQNWLTSKASNQDLKFREKKEAYVGMLQALHEAAVHPSEVASKNFAYWQLRCELVAPENIRKAIQKIVDTNEDACARNVAYADMKDLLRVDLGIAA